MFSYDSPKWKHLRGVALRRDHYICQICKRYGKQVQATEVHHVAHVDAAPELAYELSNLISLCHSCHNKMHPEKAQKANQRRRTGSGYVPPPLNS